MGVTLVVRKCRTIILPLTHNKVWEDPRQEEGALLFPDRYGEKETNEKKHFLGAYGYAGQYQQRPSPQTGGIFHKKSFRIWGHKSIHDLPRFKEIFCSVDTAMETNENSSYSACTSWGLFSEGDVDQLILLGLFKKKVPFKVLCEKMRDLSEDCRDDGEQMIDRSLSIMFRPEYFLIEKKTLGAPLGQYLLDMGINVQFFNTGNKYQGYHGSKIERARSCGYFLGSEDNDNDQGIIWLLGEERDNLDKLYRFSHKFLKDALLFPNGESSDVVDTFSQAVLHLKNCGYLKHPVDIKAQKEREREAYYNSPF